MTSTIVEHVEQMRLSLVALHDDLSGYHCQSSITPMPGSKAAREIIESGDAEKLQTALAQGQLWIECAADHTYALTRLIVEPVSTMAPWTCFRGALESAAFACWILDNRIDFAKRIGRSYAACWKELSAQLKLANAMKDRVAAARVRTLIAEAEDEARVAGYRILKNSKGEHIGIAEHMPSATDCIRGVLDEEILFRIASAMAHGETYALIRLGFHVPNTESPLMIAKHVKPETFALQLLTAADCLAKPLWARTNLFGHDSQQMTYIFERRYLELGAAEKRFFWRNC
jgi:hypothetical protein